MFYCGAQAFIHTVSTVHVECMYASTHSMHCKIHSLFPVAALLAGTRDSDDTLSQKIDCSTQQTPRYGKTEDIHSKHKLQRE